MNCVIKIGAVMWMMSISKCMPIPEERERKREGKEGGMEGGREEERKEEERKE